MYTEENFLVFRYSEYEKFRMVMHTICRMQNIPIDDIHVTVNTEETTDDCHVYNYVGGIGWYGKFFNNIR